jgi:hypothetical protein
MKAIAESITRVRTYQSGAVTMLRQPVLRIKGFALGDDTADVRVAAGPYRIVMHCQSVVSKRTDKLATNN